MCLRAILISARVGGWKSIIWILIDRVTLFYPSPIQRLYLALQRNVLSIY
jgi:hypothetical protein